MPKVTQKVAELSFESRKGWGEGTPTCSLGGIREGFSQEVIFELSFGGRDELGRQTLGVRTCLQVCGGEAGRKR